MPMFHEPFLQLSQLRPHLTPLLCKTPSDRTLLLCVLPMGRTSCCKPRQAILCLGSYASTAVQATAPVALVCRPLARLALTGLGPAPLAGPIGAKAPRNALLEPTFSHLKTYRCLGISLYPIIRDIARVWWFGLFQNLTN